MALVSSGQIKFSQIQAEFGGSHPISISEYKRNGTYVYNLGANSDIPTTNSDIQISDFYGAKKCYDAGGSTLYTHSSGYSSVGEGFFRELEAYTVPHCGVYGISGTYVVGSSYPSKCIDVEIWINDTKIIDLYAICDGSFHTISSGYNTNTTLLQAGDKIRLMGYVWGNFGSDRFESSSLTVQAY